MDVLMVALHLAQRAAAQHQSKQIDGYVAAKGEYIVEENFQLFEIWDLKFEICCQVRKKRIERNYQKFIRKCYYELYEFHELFMMINGLFMMILV